MTLEETLYDYMKRHGPKAEHAELLRRTSWVPPTLGEAVDRQWRLRRGAEAGLNHHRLMSHRDKVTLMGVGR